MLDKFFNSFEITPDQVKIFVATFIAMSVIVGMQRLGLHSFLPFLSLDK